MEKIYICKRKRIIMQRLCVVCSLLMAAIVISIILSMAKDPENTEVFSDIPKPTLMGIADDIPEEQPITMEEIERDPRYGFTYEEIYLLAQALSGDGSVDGDGEYDIDFQNEINYYEVGKVLGVIMNRVRSEYFPDTVTDVVTQEGQFIVMPHNLTTEPSNIALQIVEEWCIAYDNYINCIQIIPEDHLFFRGNGISNITRAKFDD